mmetsp:Transcript_6090/g.13875  ORF Transcript_6090/g.13875 Transcript_6090/m.13875 type:complete len:278 (-) Transcript_6090:1716-2549(-)
MTAASAMLRAPPRPPTPAAASKASASTSSGISRSPPSSMSSAISSMSSPSPSSAIVSPMSSRAAEEMPALSTMLLSWLPAPDRAPPDAIHPANVCAKKSLNISKPFAIARKATPTKPSDCDSEVIKFMAVPAQFEKNIITPAAARSRSPRTLKRSATRTTIRAVDVPISTNSFTRSRKGRKATSRMKSIRNSATMPYAACVVEPMPRRRPVTNLRMRSKAKYMYDLWWKSPTKGSILLAKYPRSMVPVSSHSPANRTVFMKSHKTLSFFTPDITQRM